VGASIDVEQRVHRWIGDKSIFDRPSDELQLRKRGPLSLLERWTELGAGTSDVLKVYFNGHPRTGCRSLGMDQAASDTGAEP